MFRKAGILLRKQFSLLFISMILFSTVNIGTVFSQTTTQTQTTTLAFDLTKVESGWKTINSELIKVVIKVFQGILFGYMVWEVAEGWLNKQLHTKWMSIIGMGLFLALLGMLPVIYEWVTGYKPIN